MRTPEQKAKALAQVRQRVVQKRRDNGKCVYCGQTADATKSQCKKCQEYRSKLRKDHKLNGRCGCGRELVVGFKRCKSCIDSAKMRRDRKKAEKENVNLSNVKAL